MTTIKDLSQRHYLVIYKCHECILNFLAAFNTLVIRKASRDMNQLKRWKQILCLNSNLSWPKDPPNFRSFARTWILDPARKRRCPVGTDCRIYATPGVATIIAVWTHERVRNHVFAWNMKHTFQLKGFHWSPATTRLKFRMPLWKKTHVTWFDYMWIINLHTLKLNIWTLTWNLNMDPWKKQNSELGNQFSGCMLIFRSVYSTSHLSACCNR